MTLINIQKRFLLMFADYREAIERAQKHDDEILHLRGVNDELKAQLAQERSDNLARERALNDKLMDMRFGRRAMNPDSTSVSSSPTLEQAAEQPAVRQWQKGMWSQLEKDVRDYHQKVSGTTGPVTN